MADVQELLSQLKDVHLPPPIGWWPPAPGWWIVAALVLLLLTTGAFWGWQRWQRCRRRQRLQQAFAIIEARWHKEADPLITLMEVTRFLKQAAFTRYPRSEIAGLHGMAWLTFLDRIVGSEEFSQGCGHCLLDSPYRPHPQADVTALLKLVNRWLRRLYV